MNKIILSSTNLRYLTRVGLVVIAFSGLCIGYFTVFENVAGIVFSLVVFCLSIVFTDRVATEVSFDELVENFEDDSDNDVITYLSTIADQLPTGEHVYIIQDTSHTGLFKIGRSNNPRRRLYNFDVTLPMKLSLVHLIPCKDCIIAEASLHRHFASKRQAGEWFNLSAKDISFIKSIGSM